MGKALEDLSDLGEYFGGVAYNIPGCLSVTAVTAQNDPIIIWETEDGEFAFQGVPMEDNDGRGWLSDGDRGIWPLTVLHPLPPEPPRAITPEERAAVLASDTPNRCPKCGEDYPATKFGRRVHELTCVRPMPEVSL